MELRLNIPDDVAAQLQPLDGDLSRRILEIIALEGYKSEELTAYQVQQMLGFQTRMDVDGFLRAHGIPLEYTLEDLKKDRAALELPMADRLKLIQMLTEELNSNEDISPFEPNKVYYLPTPYNSFGVAEVLMTAMAADNSEKGNG